MQCREFNDPVGGLERDAVAVRLGPAAMCVAVRPVRALVLAQHPSGQQLGRDTFCSPCWHPRVVPVLFGKDGPFTSRRLVDGLGDILMSQREPRTESLCSSHIRPYKRQEEATMLVGYAPVSTAVGSRTTDPQRDAVVEAGVDDERLYEDRASGQRNDRPGLPECLESLRDGDTLRVWKLDRLRR